MNSDSNWYIDYQKITTGKKSYGQEAILTLGNGYLGWRGAPVFSQFDQNHYPGLYLAGLYNQTSTMIAGREVVNEDLVNLPNPQLIRIFVDGQKIEEVNRHSWLDFATGQEIDEYDFKTTKGLLRAKTTKVVDPIEFHLLGFELELTPEFEGEIQVDSVVDTQILNQNVQRYRDFDSREFEVDEISEQQVSITTRQSARQVKLFVQTTNDQGIKSYSANTTTELVERFNFAGHKDHTYKFAKVIGIATKHDLTKTVQTTSLNEIFKHSFDYWQSFWRDHDLVVENDQPNFQRLVRLNIFHLQQAANHHANQFLDASVPARGLTGEGYRGHIFWDELFILPYYTRTEPDVAKDLLKYRINRLPAARRNAELAGEKGAMYPWQSGMTGDEQAQSIHLNPLNNEWEPDNSRLQRHVSLAIAYDVWDYYQVTDDQEFMDQALAMILGIAKFWLNKVRTDGQGRYDLCGVMGPDEFHEKYPDAASGGFKNNAYTNIMVSWLLDWIIELSQDFKIDAVLLQQAKEVSHKLNLEIRDGIIAQFAGYFELKEIDLAAYAKEYGDIHRIDRVLKSIGKSPDEYQVAKQADALMCIYNLGAQKTKQIIERLGYDLPADWLARNTEYYLARTTHGSTTSRPVFAMALTDIGQSSKAAQYLMTSLEADFADIQGGTTAEGIHVGVMGETTAVIMRSFAGIDFEDGKLQISPKLPAGWQTIILHLTLRHVNYRIEVTAKEVIVTAFESVEVGVCGQNYLLNAHEPKVILVNQE
ncbi:glycosyl hydrolase family 65 protein [Xylocopilactobacillus apicola]|uniref:Trehalose 6-phosphate phosphorylase n=1 Tax=Xylocopilactobacillus apicola TaxID=2932184 RepID=A0AAU9D715_9LACO|nr:glycosyl hydrolase family 65 protein [Xylocopilactobacillus apicola]BDR59664.1 trehalose 6-phosphate phosphorylase [Xylocopilactobacillus apicola]